MPLLPLLLILLDLALPTFQPAISTTLEVLSAPTFVDGVGFYMLTLLSLQQNHSSHLIKSPKTSANIPLRLLTSPSISEDLNSLDNHQTFYCDDILGTVPSLRHLTTLVLSQSLVSLQIFKEYLLREYLV
jgi:hypothetical protein